MASKSQPLAGWAPQWPASLTGAWMSTRHGGVSLAPHDSLNLGLAVDDQPDRVLINRQRFASALGGATPVFLQQLHGVRVIRLCAADLGRAADEPPLEADAAVCTEIGIACTIQVADCLAVLFTAPQGLAVGAAHAGWRGLAAGVLEATLTQICQLATCSPDQVQAWLGPCIGPRHFEVGVDVRESFSLAPAHCFKASSQPLKYLADLPALARWRLHSAGMISSSVHGGQWCTVEDSSRFFSFRREGVTGRMGAAVWRVGAARG